MASDGEKLNSFEDNKDKWQDLSDYKKALWLSKNEPDCRFILTSQFESPKAIPAHKWILKCASSKFETLFANNVKEVQLDDTEQPAFKKFLDYIYFGDAENLLAADAITLKHLISLGKTYQMNSVVEICIDIMKQNLHKSQNHDLIGIFEYACLIEDDELISECKKVIVGRVESKIKFHDFNFNKPEEKRHILSARKELSTPAVNNGNLATSLRSNGISESNNVAQSSAFGSKNNNSFSFGLNPSPAPIFGASSTANSGSTTQTSIFAPVGPIASQNKTEIPILSGFSSQTSAAAANTEEKIQNTENIIKEPTPGNIFNNPMMPISLSKGDITKCSCIFELNPSIFYEFQITLSGHIPEYVRFNMIETYAKINNLITDPKENKHNNDVEMKSSPELPNQQFMIASTKQILNMMLRSIKFHRMSAKEFIAGPGKSLLLDIAEKYDLLVSIVNKN